MPTLIALFDGLPDIARPQTGHKPTQRRIDLLAIEQNAWTLAARDDRCVVVARPYRTRFMRTVCAAAAVVKLMVT